MEKERLLPPKTLGVDGTDEQARLVAVGGGRDDAVGGGRDDGRALALPELCMRGKVGVPGGSGSPLGRTTAGVEGGCAGVVPRLAVPGVVGGVKTSQVAS